MTTPAKEITIKSATPLTGRRVKIGWSDGGSDVVDLDVHLQIYAEYAPIRTPNAFKTMYVDEDGAALSWLGGIDIPIGTLERLVREQAQAMSGAVLKRWRMDKELDQGQLAELLGLSRRTVIRYEAGEEPIPRPVSLATLYLDSIWLKVRVPPRGVATG
jgi:DNA-binding XRE family transcriptional regulator